jgi:anti-anti-sigma factor
MSDPREPADGGIDLGALIEAIDARVASGETLLVVNLRDVGFLSSKALGYFIRTRKQLTGAGGDLVLSEVSDVVARTLRVMGLNEVFRVFPTDDEAYAYLEKKS